MNEVILSTFFGNEITGEKRIIFFFLDIISRKYDLFLIIRFGTFTLSPTFSLASIRQPFVSAYFYISSRWTISHRLFPWFRLRFVALDIKTRKKKKRNEVEKVARRWHTTDDEERTIDRTEWHGTLFVSTTTIRVSILLVCIRASSRHFYTILAALIQPALFSYFFRQHYFHIYQTTLFSYFSSWTNVFLIICYYYCCWCGYCCY